MESKTFCSKKCAEFVEKVFTESALPSIMEYIKIDNLSRAFDKEWNTNGKLEKAAEHIKSWVENLGIKGLKTEIIKEKNANGEYLSPIIFTVIEGELDITYFFYGHFDKQPPFNGWD